MNDMDYWSLNVYFKEPDGFLILSIFHTFSIYELDIFSLSTELMMQLTGAGCTCVWNTYHHFSKEFTQQEWCHSQYNWSSALPNTISCFGETQSHKKLCRSGPSSSRWQVCQWNPNQKPGDLTWQSEWPVKPASRLTQWMRGQELPHSHTSCIV